MSRVVKLFVVMLVFLVTFHAHADVHVNLTGLVTVGKAHSIASTLKRTKDKRAVMTITSPGGDVRGEQIIINAMQAYKARGGRITVIVRGYAASAAASVSCYGNNLVMRPGSYRLFHPMAIETNGQHIPIVKSNRHLVPASLWNYSHNLLVHCGLSSRQIYAIEVNGREIRIYANGRVMTRGHIASSLRTYYR